MASNALLVPFVRTVSKACTVGWQLTLLTYTVTLHNTGTGTANIVLFSSGSALRSTQNS